jgi:hypothetical protein
MVFDIVLEMVLNIIVSWRSFFWEVACLWHGNKGGKYENILYFNSCNGKWLKVYHVVFILFYLEDVR